MTDRERQRHEMVAWAKKALHGLDDSAVFVGVLDDRPLDAARVEFTLQLGHSVLTNKLIVLPVPFGVEVAPKLLAVADRIVRYDPKDLRTLQANLAVALTEMGANVQ